MGAVLRSELAKRLDVLEAELVVLGKEFAQIRLLLTEEERSSELALETPAAAEPMHAPKPEPAHRAEPAPPVAERPRSVPAPPAPTPPPAPRPSRRSLGQLAKDWDLVGARGFAIVGGVVLALGIGLFFVLAANRGWIDERARVALGAAASAAALGTGIWLRSRFGQYWAALGAVGAGIAGSYATLAAATARYDLVPDGLGLPIAGAIAAVGTIVAVRWHSQVIAGIGLLGAALAPALQALDTGLTWESVAFALIVLVATASVAVPRAWHELLHAVTAVVAIQALWLAADVGAPADEGTVAVTAALIAVVLATAVGLQLTSARPDLEPLALTYALVAFGLPLVTTSRLFDDQTDRGIALVAAAGIWAVALGLLAWRRKPDLALVVGVSALALTALGTALLVSGGALTLAWAAQAIVLAVLAARFADARLHVTAIAYAALASLSALGGEGLPAQLFDSLADHRAAIVPLAASAVAFVATGLAARPDYARRTERGLLSFVADARAGFEAHHVGVRESLVFAGAALATLAAAFALVSLSYDWGHVAATSLGAAVGAVILGYAGMRRRDELATAAYVWLGCAISVALAFDVPEFHVSETGNSIGGWALLAGAAALLGGAFVQRLGWPVDGARDVLLACFALLAAVAAALGIAFVVATSTGGGVGLLGASAVYAGLSAAIFRRPGRRDVSTILWSLALTLLVGAELLLVTSETWRAVPVVATALAVGVLARPLGEERLWLAGGALAVATTGALLLVWNERLVEGTSLTRDLAIATGACAIGAFALAALRWREARLRDVATILWAVGVVAALATERALLVDPRATAIAFALTGGALALAARPLRETRLWAAGATVVGVTLVATVVEWTPPSHLLLASASPADGLWVLLACITGLAVVAATSEDARTRVALEVVTGGIALYALSLGILEVAERVSGASVETDFERGHTAVSGLWALVGLALLVAGLLRGSTAIRYGGLALFGLSLAKIFLYDLSSLSSLARAFSFILVGGLLLAGGFFLQRLSGRLGPPRHP